MADQGQGAASPQEKPLSKTAKILTILFIIGGGAYFLKNVLSAKPEQIAELAEKVQPNYVNPADVAKQDQVDQQQASEAENRISFDPGVKANEIYAQQKKLEEMQKNLEGVTQQLEADRKAAADRETALQNKMDRQIGELVEAITNNDYQGIEAIRRGSAEGGEPDALPGASRPGPLPSVDGGTGPAPAQTYRSGGFEFPYTRYGSGGGDASAGAGGARSGQASARAGGSGDEGSSGDSQKPSTLSQKLDEFNEDGVPQTAITPGGGVARGEAPAEGKPQQAPASVVDVLMSKPAAAATQRIIPAFSYAAVTNLHGVSCPVIGGASGGLGEQVGGALATQRPPVVVPVTGPFHGPQGRTYSMQRVHMLGACEGIKGDRPTANVVVSRMSYTDSAGNQKLIAVQGYLIDRRDNIVGIRGDFETRRGEDIAMSSIAAAMAGLGQIGQAATFTTTIGGSGNPTQILQDGKLPQAAGFGAVANAANEVAKFFREEASRHVDVVNIPAGVPVFFVNIEPIKYEDTDTDAIASGDSYERPPL